MRLLFDQNLSPRLVDRLNDVFPQALHVSQVGLSRAPDEALWDYARVNALVICTKDTDFLDMSVLNGFPPKIVWLAPGDYTTAQVEALLRQHAGEIEAFATDDVTGILTLY
jgi:predicted nuclease of predicted toxin-antitoxin system